MPKYFNVFFILIGFKGLLDFYFQRYTLLGNTPYFSLKLLVKYDILE